MKLLPAVQNYCIMELELIGLICTIHGFIKLLEHCYFEVLVDHEVSENLWKRKKEHTINQVIALLLMLHNYTFDPKY